MTHSNRNSGVCDTCHQTSCCCAPSDCRNEAGALQIYQSQLDQLTSAMLGKISERTIIRDEMEEIAEELAAAELNLNSVEKEKHLTTLSLEKRRQEWRERLACCRIMHAKIAALETGLRSSLDITKKELKRAQELLEAAKALVASHTVIWEGICGELSPEECLGSDPDGTLADAKARIAAWFDDMTGYEEELNGTVDAPDGLHALEADAEAAVADGRAAHADAMARHIAALDWDSQMGVIKAWIIQETISSPQNMEAWLQANFEYDSLPEGDPAGDGVSDASDPLADETVDVDTNQETAMVTATAVSAATLAQIDTHLTAEGCDPCDADIHNILVAWHNHASAVVMGSGGGDATAMDVAIALEDRIRVDLDDYLYTHGSARHLELDAGAKTAAELDAAVTAAADDLANVLEPALAAAQEAREDKEREVRQTADLIEAEVAGMAVNDNCGAAENWAIWVDLKVAETEARLLSGRIAILQRVKNALEAAIARSKRYSERCCDGTCECNPCDATGKVPGRVTLTFSPDHESIRTRMHHFWNTVIYQEPASDGSDANSRRVDGNDMFAPGYNLNSLTGQGELLASAVIENRLVIGLNKQRMTEVMAAMQNSEGQPYQYDEVGDREKFVYSVYRWVQNERALHSQSFDQEVAQLVADVKTREETSLAAAFPNPPEVGSEEEAKMNSIAEQIEQIKPVESSRLISKNSSNEHFGLDGMDIVIVDTSTADENYTAVDFHTTALYGYNRAAPIGAVDSADDSADDGSNNSASGAPDPSVGYGLTFVERTSFGADAVQGWAGSIWPSSQTAGNKENFLRDEPVAPDGTFSAELVALMEQDKVTGLDVGSAAAVYTMVVPVGSVTIQLTDHQSTTLHGALEEFHTRSRIEYNGPHRVDRARFVMKRDPNVAHFILTLEGTYPELFDLFFASQANVTAILTAFSGVDTASRDVETLASISQAGTALFGKDGIMLKRYALNVMALDIPYATTMGTPVNVADKGLHYLFKQALRAPYAFSADSLETPMYSDLFEYRSKRLVGDHLVFERRANAGNIVKKWELVGPTPYSNWLCEEKDIVARLNTLDGLITMGVQMRNLLQRRLADMKTRLCGGHPDACNRMALRGVNDEIRALDLQRQYIAAKVRELALAIANCGKTGDQPLPSAGIQSISDLLVTHLDVNASEQLTYEAARAAELDAELLRRQQVIDAQDAALTELGNELAGLHAAHHTEAGGNFDGHTHEDGNHSHADDSGDDG